MTLLFYILIQAKTSDILSYVWKQTEKAVILIPYNVFTIHVQVSDSGAVLVSAIASTY